MYLTLEVVSPQAASMGAEQRKIVGPRGLTIGRVPGNDWVFSDPYVSKHDARISFSNGSFLIEGLGSEQRKIVGRRGLTIGRVPGNDWVFSDPYVSKHHARISFSNGSFLIEGL